MMMFLFRIAKIHGNGVPSEEKVASKKNKLRCAVIASAPIVAAISLQFRKSFFLQQNSEKGCANKSALEPVICTKTAPFFCPPNLNHFILKSHETLVCSLVGFWADKPGWC